MTGDLYQLLGIQRDAEDAEIRHSYRRLARQYHPDLNPGAEAEEFFKKLSQAFSILSDPHKRRLYDEFGEQSLHLDFDPNPACSANPPSDEPAHQAPGPSAQPDMDPAPEVRGSPSDVESTLEIDLALALTGGTLRISSPTGGAALTVTIPCGAHTGERIKLPGRGRPGVRGGRPGDLYLEILVRENPHFLRQGEDLLLLLPITVEEAVKGARVEVPTLKGRVRIQVPANSMGGEIFRVPGKGPPGPNNSRGDLLVLLSVRLPDQVRAASREIERLAKLYSQPVRGGLTL